MESTPTLDSLGRERTVLLTSRRKDGTPVGTPVSIVTRGEHAYFRTYDRAFKVKRLARDPEVEIAPSTYRGKATGPAVRGSVRLLTEDEARPVRRMLARKHPFLHGFAVPLFHRLKRYRTLHYEVTLVPELRGSPGTARR